MHQPLFVLFYNISNQIPSSTITFKVIILYIYTMPHLIVVGSYAPLRSVLLAPGAHSQFGSGKNTQFEPEQRANPFENVFSKTAVFPPPAIAETDL